MKNNLLPHDTTNGSVQNKPLGHHDTWVHQNLSHYFTSTDNETSNQLPPHMVPLPITSQQFNKDFQALQQQIQEQHLILEAKIQSFLEFFEQQPDNPSQTVSPLLHKTPWLTWDTRVQRSSNIFWCLLQLYPTRHPLPSPYLMIEFAAHSLYYEYFLQQEWQAIIRWWKFNSTTTDYYPIRYKTGTYSLYQTTVLWLQCN